MPLLDDLKMFARFGWELPGFLRNPYTLEEARSLVARLIEEREENFLRIVRRAIYGYPKSPYLAMLRMADCAYGDLESMVRRKGLESTLHALREEEVYVDFEECKGRKRLIRQGKEIPTGPVGRLFQNPFLSKHFYSESGGSTGAGTRVPHDLQHYSVLSAHEMLAFEAQGVLGYPMAVWRGVLPDGSGIGNVLRSNRYGYGPEKWFTPVMPGELGQGHLRFKLATYFTVIVGKLSGGSIPWPESVHLDEAGVIAEWVKLRLDESGGCIVQAAVSRALRVCVAAEEKGMDLQGCVFRIAGESLTPAKARGILRTGARIFMSYGFSEAGRLGMACANPLDPSDVHLLDGVCALIPYPRAVPGTETEVPAYNITSLSPTSPRILLNAENDDYGVIETRECGCPMGDVGMHRHLRHIRSFCKLTGEGVTLVGSEMVEILEGLLPEKFGGSPLDYQLMEEEDEAGLTRICLLIDPKVGPLSEEEVIRTVLHALREKSVMAASAERMWEQAGSFRIKREPPRWTARGKLMTLHVAARLST